MNKTEHSYIYKIGGLNLKFFLDSKQLKLSSGAGSYKFILDDHEFKHVDYSISFSLSNNIQTPLIRPSFSASSFDENQIPYEWGVYEHKENFTVIIKVNDDLSFKLIKAIFDLKRRSVNVQFEMKENYKLDPFFQPLGPILLNYITHHAGGVMLHSSGVKDNENGYVFTAVSGTGKSTMAGLWQKTGAQIINDDRLVLIPGNDGVMMTNTPMPYYQDVYKESPVTAIFLIKQSPENYLKPLPGAAGVAGLMSNCIQFLYNKKMVQKHLEALTAIAEKSPIYELGFKPDTEITDIIRREFGG